MSNMGGGVITALGAFFGNLFTVYFASQSLAAQMHALDRESTSVLRKLSQRLMLIIILISFVFMRIKKKKEPVVVQGAIGTIDDRVDLLQEICGTLSVSLLIWKQLVR